MKQILFYLITVPAAVLLTVFAVINRQPVTVTLDPFSPENPALAFEVPLSFLLIGAVVLGIVIGGIADWVRQGRHRKAAREGRYEAARLRNQVGALRREKQKTTPDDTPIKQLHAGLPAPR